MDRHSFYLPSVHSRMAHLKRAQINFTVSTHYMHHMVLLLLLLEQCCSCCIQAILVLVWYLYFLLFNRFIQFIGSIPKCLFDYYSFYNDYFIITLVTVQRMNERKEKIQTHRSIWTKDATSLWYAEMAAYHATFSGPLGNLSCEQNLFVRIL